MDIIGIILWNILPLIVVLGVLVFFHEFGHFIVARICGVGVLTFSLGFGRKLISRKWGETEYCVSVLPLGGYVRLLGDDPNEEISPENLHRSFLKQGFGKKFAIVIAGPVFNLLLAFVLYAFINMMGVPALSSHIGEVEDNSAAAHAGIQPNDHVVAVDGEKVEYWSQIMEAVDDSNGRALRFTVLRESEEVRTEVIPMMREQRDIFGDLQKAWTIGIQEKILPVVGSVQVGTPAEQAGFKPDDIIVRVGEREITLWQQIRESIQEYGGQEVAIGILRAGEPIEFSLTPVPSEVKDAPVDWKIGIIVKGPPRVIRRYSPVMATILGAEQTWYFTKVNTIGLFKLIQGKISAKSIGGPILIAQMSSKFASQGVHDFLFFMALISINLGIINLFPIPILDGGHLLIFSIEGVLGRPLSLGIREKAQQVGLFIIISIMIFAFYNDFMRFFQ